MHACVARASRVAGRVLAFVMGVLRALLMLIPSRVLWVRAMDPAAPVRWTGLYPLLSGAPVIIAPGADHVAMVALHRGELLRHVVSRSLIAGQRQRAAAERLAAVATTDAIGERPGLLGVLHNRVDVTLKLRPWFSAISHGEAGVSASGVACLVGGRAERAADHVVNALWDDFTETRSEGSGTVRVKAE